jgi:hypothetical protein
VQAEVDGVLQPRTHSAPRQVLAPLFFESPCSLIDFASFWGRTHTIDTSCDIAQREKKAVKKGLSVCRMLFLFSFFLKKISIA